MNKNLLKKQDSISVIFPAYNEEMNIERAIMQAISVVKMYFKDFEIIIVNDGSTDKTEKIVRKLQNSYSQIQLVNQKNRGYGGALVSGFKKASKDWIFFTDADLQFNINQISQLLIHRTNFDFIFGYRIKRADNIARRIIEICLKVWDRLLFGLPFEIKDIDCAFKLMKRVSLISLGKINSEGAMISTELILKVLNSNYKIKQVGVNHFPRLEGKPKGFNIGVLYKAIKETVVLKKTINKPSIVKNLLWNVK